MPSVGTVNKYLMEAQVRLDSALLQDTKVPQIMIQWLEN